MNIDDQELAQMDISLRSRFHMIKMEPIPQVLPTIMSGDLQIDLAKLLETVNARITVLLGHGKGVGHAYLLSVGNFQELKLAFYGKVMPILNDLFNSNSKKLGLVLGKGFFHKIEFDKTPILAQFDVDVNAKYGKEKGFLLKTFDEVDELDFIRIYDETASLVTQKPG